MALAGVAQRSLELGHLAGYLIRILPPRRSLQPVGVVVGVLSVVNVVALFS